jgi:hypothetical protein
MTTLTIADLEAFLGGLGLNMPIPHFSAANVLNKPLDIGRSYFADILCSLIDCDAKAAYIHDHKDPTFSAIEVLQYSGLLSYSRQSSSIMLECSVNPNLGDLEMICNSLASHLSHHTIQQATIDGLLKGWNEEWGSLQLPCSRARIGKLLDRDYVWAVTQTMVSFENLALWAVHTVRYYKVYPGFWGRRFLSFKSRALNNTSIRKRARCGSLVP